ncbi:STE20-like serine/threonine-protein kinase isoform X2 [Limulus polyphemus]|uniref:non-specific serine/threonine protein kinase n=1 Tax=Limulus polyphemus TaxID=6850 RepID=A0ABM1SL05_LIMPO|nr:STE20-like serine/threonine-protein kinase isoform X2 [Limulus polyphemus]
MEKYSHVKQIGKGSYGEVWLVRHCTSSKQSPDGILNIIMGYCEGGDLYSLIRKRKGSLFDESQVAQWSIQICMALQYLHDHKILHRDLKTQNIFLTKNKVIKVGDLGIARVLDGTLDMATTLIGTPYYMSPELFSNKPYNHKSDVWSLGCCLYEMATLRHAFNAQNLNSLMYKVLQGKLPPMPKHYSLELQALIKSMLSCCPEHRPSIRQILENEYIHKHMEIFLEETKSRSKGSKKITNASESKICDDFKNQNSVSHEKVGDDKAFSFVNPNKTGKKTLSIKQCEEKSCVVKVCSTYTVESSSHLGSSTQNHCVEKTNLMKSLASTMHENRTETTSLEKVTCENRTETCDLEKVTCENRTETSGLENVTCENRTETCGLENETCENRTETCGLENVTCENRTGTCGIEKVTCENRTETCGLENVTCENRTGTCGLENVTCENRTGTCGLENVTCENRTGTCGIEKGTCENRTETCGIEKVTCENRTETCGLEEVTCENRTETHGLGKVTYESEDKKCESNLYKESDKIIENSSAFVRCKQEKDYVHADLRDNVNTRELCVRRQETLNDQRPFHHRVKALELPDRIEKDSRIKEETVSIQQPTKINIRLSVEPRHRRRCQKDTRSAVITNLDRTSSHITNSETGKHKIQENTTVRKSISQSASEEINNSSQQSPEITRTFVVFKETVSPKDSRKLVISSTKQSPMYCHSEKIRNAPESYNKELDIENMYSKKGQDIFNFTSDIKFRNSNKVIESRLDTSTSDPNLSVENLFMQVKDLAGITHDQEFHRNQSFEDFAEHTKNKPPLPHSHEISYKSPGRTRNEGNGVTLLPQRKLSGPRPLPTRPTLHDNSRPNQNEFNDVSQYINYPSTSNLRRRRSRKGEEAFKQMHEPSHVITSDRANEDKIPAQSFVKPCRSNSAARQRRREKHGKQKSEEKLLPNLMSDRKLGSISSRNNICPSSEEQVEVTRNKQSLKVEDISCVSSCAGDEEKGDDPEMADLMTALNTSLRLSSSAPEKLSSKFPAYEDDSSNRINLDQRIKILTGDCLMGLSEDLLKKALQILGNGDKNHPQRKLKKLLGEKLFTSYAGKLWQLKYCQGLYLSYKEENSGN